MAIEIRRATSARQQLLDFIYRNQCRNLNYRRVETMCLRKNEQYNKKRANRCCSALTNVLLVCVVMIVFTQAGCHRESSAHLRPTILPVDAVQLHISDGYTVTRTFIGPVAAQQTTDLAFEIAGKITELYFREGDSIRSGQVVGRLDSTLLLAQKKRLSAIRTEDHAVLAEMKNGPRHELISTAAAHAEDLQAQYERGLQKKQRAKSLLKKNAISQDQFDDSSFGATALWNRLKAAKSVLAELQAGTRPEQIIAQNARIAAIDAEIQAIDIKLAKCSLVAPYKGVLAKRAVDTGTATSAGETVVTIMEDKPCEVRVHVPTRFAKRFSVDQSRTIQIEDESYDAVVVSSTPVVDSVTNTVEIVLQLGPETSGKVFPGEIAKLEIAVPKESKGFWLPTSALVGSVGGLWSCYCLQPDTSNDRLNKPAIVVRRDVIVLHEEHDRVFVTGSLPVHSWIVQSGTHRIVPGQLVRKFFRNVDPLSHLSSSKSVPN